MKFAKHITFFYDVSRFIYLNEVINAANRYSFPTDIFIHTNINITLTDLAQYTNGKLEMVIHDLTNENPFYLTWKCRDLIKKQYEENQYDVYMYVEDDIMVPMTAINYWLQYKDLIGEYNLGFTRIEVNQAGIEVLTDNTRPMTHIFEIDQRKYVLNDANPYCAFWIYEKNTMGRWINSPWYDIRSIHGYGEREASAIGLHSPHVPWFKGTVIPLEALEGTMNVGCKIYHLPNNYALRSSPGSHGSVPFLNAIC